MSQHSSIPLEKVPRVNVPDAWNQITRRVIGCAVLVHGELGTGLLEKLYEEALCYEMASAGLHFERQAARKVRYKDIVLSSQVFDLIVEDLVVVELKVVERLHDVHLAQLLSYMRSADLPLGLIINFNSLRLVDGVHRRINARSHKFAAVKSAANVATTMSVAEVPSEPTSTL